MVCEMLTSLTNSSVIPLTLTPVLAPMIFIPDNVINEHSTQDVNITQEEPSEVKV